MTRQAADVAAAGRAQPAAGPADLSNQRWRAAFFALMAVAIVAGAGWALLESRFFVVRGVAVTGTHLVAPAEVRSAADIPAGLPLIRVNTTAVAHRVEQIPQVQSTQVSREWPDRVLISVTERTPALAVPSGHDFELIDKDGVVVESVSERPLDMPVLDLPAGTQPAALRGSPDVYAAAVVVRELPRYLTRSLVSVQAPSAGQVTLRLSNGVSIIWGGADRAAEKAKELAVLMRTHARSYDVSAPGTAVTGG
ncbi:MAG TPA: FtsQ-type POTRA domain-containing protein [Streptosporangiaceae bacterium]|nr:FtsQ-type POTRA domain-containing protein [Streptosporangiaceae bacterium]